MQYPPAEITDAHFEELRGMMLRHLNASIIDAETCSSGRECDRCKSIRRRYAETAAYIVWASGETHEPGA